MTSKVVASVSLEGKNGSADLLYCFVKFAADGTPYNFFRNYY